MPWARSLFPRAPGRGMSRTLSEALHHLAAWATGVRLAYETREDRRDPGA